MSEPSQGSQPGPARPAYGADLVIPVLAAGFAVYFLVSSADLVWEARATGTVVGAVLLALIAVQVVRIVIALRERGGTLGLGKLGERSGVQGQRIALVVILGLFVALIPWLGATLGLFLMMLASMAVLGVRDSRMLLGVSLATAISFYLLFIALLHTRLPVGPIEHLIARLTGGGG